MKIIAPLVNVPEIMPMIKAGADEFYFGLDTNKNTNDVNCLNVMAIDFANIRDLNIARKAIDITHENHKKIYMCVNNELYLERQYRQIFQLLKKLERLDGIIASDPVLIKSIAASFPRLKITVSTRANILNSYDIKYYAALGAKRFVLPRHLYLKDIIDLVKTNSGYEFEIFIKNEDCPYINGFCSYTHNIWNNPQGTQIFCRKGPGERKNTIRNIKVIKDVVKNSLYLNNFIKRASAMNCGACSLATLDRIDKGNIYLKLTSRMRKIDDKLKDLKFIETIKGHLSGPNAKRYFKDKVKKSYEQIYSQSCYQRCYYASR